MNAVSRNERNIIRSEGGNVGEGSHQFDIDLFDVDQATCTGPDWGEKIDSWDIVAHNIDDAECGKYYNGMGCLCRAFFSLGAIMGQPHFICQPCSE